MTDLRTKKHSLGKDPKPYLRYDHPNGEENGIWILVYESPGDWRCLYPNGVIFFDKDKFPDAKEQAIRSAQDYASRFGCLIT